MVWLKILFLHQNYLFFYQSNHNKSKVPSLSQKQAHVHPQNDTNFSSKKKNRSKKKEIMTDNFLMNFFSFSRHYSSMSQLTLPFCHITQHRTSFIERWKWMEWNWEKKMQISLSLKASQKKRGDDEEEDERNKWFFSTKLMPPQFIML